MAQTERVTKQDQAVKEKGVTGTHRECGGELRRLIQDPIEAGKPGNCYIVYQCSRCGEIVFVG